MPLARGRRLGRGRPMKVRRTHPGLDQRRRRAAADLRQQGHALVGRLADLRLDRGAQPRAAHRRGRQADGRGRPPARGDRPGAARHRPDRLQRQLLGRPVDAAHAVRARSTTRSATCSRPTTRTGTTRSSSCTARLVNAALIAKIHTVEWTPGILANPVLQIAMNANWYGVAAEVAQAPHRPRRQGRAAQRHRRLASSTTTPRRTRSPSEFVSVYRLHPLIPDEYDDPLAQDRRGDRGDRLHRRSRATARATAIDKHSTGRTGSTRSASPTPARSRCTTTPNALRNLTRVNGDRVDLATIDILRDRERGVPRYNDFREKLRKRRIERFEDLTRQRGVGAADQARSTTATSTRSTPRSACSPSRCRRASASATRRSGSSS